MLSSHYTVSLCRFFNLLSLSPRSLLSRYLLSLFSLFLFYVYPFSLSPPSTLSLFLASLPSLFLFSLYTDSTLSLYPFQYPPFCISTLLSLILSSLILFFSTLSVSYLYLVSLSSLFLSLLYTLSLSCFSNPLYLLPFLLYSLVFLPSLSPHFTPSLYLMYLNSLFLSFSSLSLFLSTVSIYLLSLPSVFISLICPRSFSPLLSLSAHLSFLSLTI